MDGARPGSRRSSRRNDLPAGVRPARGGPPSSAPVPPPASLRLTGPAPGARSRRATCPPARRAGPPGNAPERPALCPRTGPQRPARWCLCLVCMSTTAPEAGARPSDATVAAITATRPRRIHREIADLIVRPFVAPTGWPRVVVLLTGSTENSARRFPNTIWRPRPLGPGRADTAVDPSPRTVELSQP